MRRTLALALLPLTVGALSVLPSATAPAVAAPQASAAPAVQPNPDHIKTLSAVLQLMKDDYAQFGSRTPGPQDIFGYHIDDLWLKGIDGTGTTIALLEGWDDPQINSVIHTFDARYGLPDPDIQTIYPSGDGHLPAQCPPGMVALGSYGSCNAWAGELRLDVETAHLIAPYAKILISATPADSEITDDSASQVAMPEIMQALEYIGAHHLADAMSISDGTGESTYTYGAAQIRAQDPGELAAAAAGIPVMVASGDCGSVQNLAIASSQCGATTATPDTAAWDDSPWITAVGGSVPNLDKTTGARLGPDPVWHDGVFSEGAGYSSVYPRPDFQRRVASVTRSDMRSVPDITMDAQHGTSEAAPMFAAVLALAAQLNHGSVGPANDLLYQLGPQGTRAGIADVVSGNDAVTSNNKVLVPGFTATKGFDVVTGWGTVDASTFVPAVVRASRDAHGAAQREAARELGALQHSVRLTSTDVPSGGQTYLLAGGFLPQHPVRLAIDGKAVATLTANTLGTVTYLIDPALLAVPAGHHSITLQSMLITEQAGFRSA
jgi:subtilase family serine protease